MKNPSMVAVREIRWRVGSFIVAIMGSTLLLNAMLDNFDDVPSWVLIFGLIWQPVVICLVWVVIKGPPRKWLE